MTSSRLRPPASLEVHDFRQPRQLLPASWKTLQQWLAEGCKLVSDRWRKLGLAVALQPHNTYVRSLRSALEMIPEPGWGAHAILGATSIDTLLVCTPGRLRGLARRLLGDTADETLEVDSLSAVEESMAELLVHEFLQGMGDAWPGPAPLDCRVHETVPQPQRTRMFPPRTTLIVTKLGIRSISDPETPGTGPEAGPVPTAELLWFMPQAPIEDLIDIECGPPAPQPTKPHPAMTRLMRDIPVSITVELGRTYLSMSELTSLQSGDVVILEQSVHRPLHVHLGNTLKFRGRPGRLGPRRCLEIQEVLEEASGQLQVSLPNR